MNKKKVVSSRILPGLVLILSLISASVFAQDTLSLRECILVTLGQHPSSTIYQNKVSIAGQQLRQSKAALLPSISANTSLTYNPKLQVTIIPPGAFGPEETELVMGTKLASAGTIEAEQVIFNKSLILDVASSKLNNEVARLNALEDNEALIYNTAVAFYEVLSHQEKVRLSQKTEERELELQQIIKLQYEQGVIKLNEYNRAVVNLKNTQAELALHRTNYDQALLKLKFAMGLDLRTVVYVAGAVSGNEILEMPLAEQFTPSNLIAYKLDEYDLLAKEMTIKKMKAAYLPTLSLSARYGANGYGDNLNRAYNRFFDYGAVTAKLSIPIFSGFKRNAALAESRLEMENQILTQKINTDNYALSYQSSRTALFSAYTNLKKNRETLDLARTVLEASDVDYREGTATYTTWLGDDYAYKEAFSNYMASLIDYYNSRLDYEKSKGTLADYLQVNK